MVRVGGEKYTQSVNCFFWCLRTQVYTHRHTYMWTERKTKTKTETQRENIYEMIEQMKNKNRGLGTTWLTRWSAFDTGT